ncbi:hypothetical protein [Nocardioides sp. W7]|uniref:hypothetical protein n=1 Tax=Nocardioides sp. W7 TaxID=2931390 RepID=UPI001FD5028F|nr:hypothetical protein [Nocardioides sp. W7]
MSSYPSTQPLLDDPRFAPLDEPALDQPARDEPTLDAATVRATLRSMAALTRVILGVALQAPAEQAAADSPLSVDVTDSEPLAPVADAPRTTFVPDSIAMPTELPHPLDAVLGPAQPGPLEEAWTPAVSGIPRLAVVDAPPVPERQNLGLLQEIAFLDD